jgi:glutamate racemase
MYNSKNPQIGIIDPGLGTLTVAKAISLALPNEKFILLPVCFLKKKYIRTLSIVITSTINNNAIALNFELWDSLKLLTFILL